MFAGSIRGFGHLQFAAVQSRLVREVVVAFLYRARLFLEEIYRCEVQVVIGVVGFLGRSLVLMVLVFASILGVVGTLF